MGYSDHENMRNSFEEQIIKYRLAPWVARACNDEWRFCIVLKNGNKIAISTIQDIHIGDEIWLEVIVLEKDSFISDEYITTATSRNNYWIKYSEVVMFYELADT